MDMQDPNVKAKLALLPEKMLEYAEEVIMSRAHLMVGYAQILVPVDTGSLRDSIRVERGGIGLHWREVRVRAGGYVTNPKTGRLVDYAVYVEATQPFMMPAYETIREDLVEMLKTQVVAKLNE